MTRSDKKPEPQMEGAYFTEGSGLYREYIFYVLAFNEVERIQRLFFICFFIMLHFKTDKDFFVLCMHYEECSEVNGGLNSL